MMDIFYAVALEKHRQNIENGIEMCYTILM